MYCSPSIAANGDAGGNSLARCEWTLTLEYNLSDTKKIRSAGTVLLVTLNVQNVIWRKKIHCSTPLFLEPRDHVMSQGLLRYDVIIIM